jgi:flagella basal body P-ring formation protein FlgA
MEAFPIRVVPSSRAPRAPGLALRLARAVGLVLFIALAGMLRTGDARADDGAPEAAPTGLDPALEQQVRALASGGSASAPAGVTRVEVVVGQLDPRLRLAPCLKVEPYLPNNMRLWGKGRIGLRCTGGPVRWSVYLPITVKAYGRALVASVGVASGSVLAATDVVEAEVDLAEEMTAAVVDPEQAVGRTLAQALKPGQSLRQGHLKPRQWFAAGETVRVVAVGAGFSLESEGQAISNGIEGMPARVRTESGRIVTGHPVAERRVELTL